MHAASEHRGHRQQPSRPHSTKRARARFREAFETATNLPGWIEEIEFLAQPHGGPHPFAVITVTGQKVRIKVLRSYAAIETFWECYPSADVFVVVVCRGDTLRFIRQQTLRLLSDCYA